MMDMELFRLWKTDVFFDKETVAELSALDENRDRKEIEDRFYRDLEFGTGGLRGVMGAGTNRMNRYTVGKATMGLGTYLLSTFGKDVCSTRGVAVAYDTRNNSRSFAETVANVLSGMGIAVSLSDSAVPTPQLSFSVSHLSCLAGVVITASHNPKEYNGYKIYDEYGCQLVPSQAKAVGACIDAIADIRSVNFNGNDKLIRSVDITKAFVEAVLLQSRCHDENAKQNLRIVYTPLHGTGLIPVQKALEADGFEALALVPEQAIADGNFPTVVSPNPEDRRALLLGIEQAKQTQADIVLGTDPDSDRVGVAVRQGEEYQLLTGNQIGALLTDHVLSHTDLSAYSRPAVVKTEVTSELGAEIARKHGCHVFSTLTGFKFIGEKITQFELAKERKDSLCDYDFIMGYEESYGYLVGTHARDKDAVVSALLVCEMAAELKAKGLTLFDRLGALYDEYGYYEDALDSFELKGKDGLEQISRMMQKLRQGASPFANPAKMIDYQTGVAAEEGFGNLPNSNVLKYILNDGTWVAVRPSGTEPKIKIYYSVKGKDRLPQIRETILTYLGLE